MVKESGTFNEQKKAKFIRQFSRFTGVIGLVTAALLCPFVFDRYLAVSPLLKREYDSLIVFSGIVLAVSLVFLVFRKRMRAGWVLTGFTLFILIQIELAARLVIHYVAPVEKREALGASANRTYLEYTAYKGHPFLVFTGRPSVELQGNESLGKLAAFNNFGFSGSDFTVEKPAGTIRVATLGGSTTISGYPIHTEQFLNDSLATSGQFEVLNFGMTYWTSAHSLVNFILNVVDFAPDYAVFHHAWNDEKARNVPEALFRNDYSHALTYFHEPEIPDKWPLRTSVIYRSIKMKLGIQPEWASLGSATTVKDKPLITPLYKNEKELYPYERNIRTFVDLAMARNIKVVLTTQPHSTDPKIPFAYAAKAIDQGNDVMRKVAASYGNSVLFLDLDSMITGHRNDIFVDVGHMNPEGIELKGKIIARCIARDIVANRPE
jgi:hypothetical protein